MATTTATLTGSVPTLTGDPDWLQRRTEIWLETTRQVTLESPSISVLRTSALDTSGGFVFDGLTPTAETGVYYRVCVRWVPPGAQVAATLATPWFPLEAGTTALDETAATDLHFIGDTVVAEVLAARDETAQARDEAVEAAASATAPTAGVVDQVLADPDSAAAQRIAATVDPLAVAGFVAPTWTAPAPATTIPVAVLASGVMYGRSGNLLVASSDGTAWTTVRDLGSDGGMIVTLLDTSAGEVLIVREQAIYRTTGWATNRATATVTKVLDRTGLSTFYQWGVDTNPATGLCVAATYTGTQPYASRYVWKSTDGGATWSVIYDIADHFDLVPAGSTTDNCHTHLARIDPWAGDRIWISWHRAGVTGAGSVLYSDDQGATWTKLATAQPTAGIAVKRGMVFATDEYPNGLYTVPRTANPADMRYTLAYRWEADTINVAGFGQWATRSPDGERAYIAFIGDVGFKPILAQSDGVGASLMHQSPTPITTSLGDGFRGILYHGTTLYAVERRGTDFTVMTARRTLGRIAAVSPAADTAGILGGYSPGLRSVALNATASAGDYLYATVAGDFTEARGNRASLYGHGLLGGALSSIFGSGDFKTAAGAALASFTHVGEQGFCRYDLATGVGANIVNNRYGVVVGGSAAIGTTSTLVDKGTALGYATKVTHNASVALGAEVQTTAASQVHVGPRHLAAKAYASPPPAPAAGECHLYFQDVSGTLKLFYRTPSGVQEVATT